MNNIYLTEMTQTDWIHTSDEHWDESAYLKWKSEQHRMTPKYDILRSLVPL